MNKEQKPWGVSVRSYLDDSVQVEWIRVLETGFSSIHVHRNKLNIFRIEWGKLQVNYFYGDRTQPPIEYILEGNDYLVVDAGQVHQFFALTDVAATEIYVATAGATVDPEDITRYSSNGRERGGGDIVFPSDAPTLFRCSLCNQVLYGIEEWDPTVYQGAVRPICRLCRDTLSTR